MAEGWEQIDTEPPFIGRRGELAELRSGLEDARAGQGRLFLVVGDPGIGKTRLVKALLDGAGATEVRLVMAQCRPGDAPPWFPWAQVLQDCAGGLSTDLLLRLGPVASDLAMIAPELARLVPRWRPGRISQARDARVRLFDSAVSFLGSVASEGGLVLVLEDLHAADQGSLLLLERVVDGLAGAEALIIGTYDDTEVRSVPWLHRRVSGLARLGRRLVLSGLDEMDTSMLLAEATGKAPATAQLGEVHRATDGNPLFVLEAARLMDRGIAIPDGLPALIRFQLQQLPTAGQELLRMAAVLGYEFDVAALSHMCGQPRERLGRMLTHALEAGMLQEVASNRGTFRHSSFREIIYDDIRPSRRAVLHRRAGEALAEGGTVAAPRPIAALAHHFFEAARGGDAMEARHYCKLAGQAAMDALAYEEGALQYGRALEAIAVTPQSDERQRYDLFVALGRARFLAGEVTEGQEMYRRALRSARALGSPELLASAAVAYSRQPGASSDPALRSLLEEARSALGSEDNGLGAALLLALAATAKSRDTEERPSREGLEMARRVGDRETLRFALSEWHRLNMEPERLEERLSVAHELVESAAAAADGEVLVLAWLCRAGDLFESGDLSAAAADLDQAARQAKDLRLPSLVWGVTAAQAGVALLNGQFDEAEHLARRAHTAGERGDVPNVDQVFLTQLWAIRRQQGRFGGLEDVARRMVHESNDSTRPLTRAALALTLADLGRIEEARGEAEGALSGLLAGRGCARVAGLAFVAEASWRIGETETVASIHEVLRSVPSSHVVISPAWCSLGASARYLGQLSTLFGRYGEAESHFEQAHQLHERLGAAVWLAHGRIDHARMLLRRAASGDTKRAESLLNAGCEAYRLLDLPTLVQRAGELVGHPAHDRTSLPDSGTFRLEGEYWSIEYGGTQARLRDSKGLRYLSRLLSSPGHELHALDLVVGTTSAVTAPAGRQPALDGVSAGDAGAVLDAKAKAAYKRRLSELQEDMEDAQAANDLGRLHRAQQEMDFLLSELAAAMGLGGRDRRAASDGERARQSVTRAIKSAIERIGDAHPGLGDHLRTTIRTGIYSSYSPDSRVPIRWHG